MAEPKELGELNNALVANFRLKAKILSILFGGVLFFQLCTIVFLSTQTDLIGVAIPLAMVITGPIVLAIIFISELYAFRYMKQMQGNAVHLGKSFIYLTTLVEVSFPCGVMFVAGNFMEKTTLFPPMQIVNSPVLIILFIMIVLSSLLLDFRLSFFAGIVGGVEYFLINVFFLQSAPNTGPIDCVNAGVKSILIIVAGLLAGFVSKKIRSAIISSLESKNELIYNLDKRVNEKTVEVVAQKTEIENKNSMLEVKQKEILDSIHYAKRIQKTLLASDNLLNENLGEHFILYRPKDIVSGDFYWASHAPDGGKAFYLAICDSTGHGVPGAFMSLLNGSFLNEAINEKNITDPNLIFNHVREKLIHNISQDGQKDGMDGTLLCIDHTSKRAKDGSLKLTYASSHNRPLLISENKLQVLPADKMPVGKGEKIDSFTLQTINCKKGDVLYLFTDGYADQFGGLKGKKFKYKQLEEILLTNHTLPMEEQRNILAKKFSDWRGDLEQVDDVLVMGIRI